MARSIRVIALGLMLLLFSTLLSVAQQAPVSNAATYQPPVFTDSLRIEKVRNLFPVIEKMYKKYAQEKRYPGMAFGIVMDGRLIYSGSNGYADITRKKPADIHSLFRIASMTKSVTAMAILKLRDEKKLSLEDEVSRYIPVLKDMMLLTNDATPITIRNLLTHTAGFPEDNPWGDRQLGITHDEFAAMLRKGISFSNVTGVTMEYSNMGFAMLGEIIRVVSNKSYQDYITENILIPLGMTRTVWEYTKVTPGLLAHGYRWLNNNWQEEALLHDGVYGAMGGLITSIGDFSKYVAYHLAAWPPRNEEDNGPVKRSSVREMHQMWRMTGLSKSAAVAGSSAIVYGYGYGLGISRDNESKTYVGHSGGLPGFGSNWMILPDYGIGVVSYGNLTYAGLTPINKAVLDTLVNQAGLMPRQLLVSPVLQQRKEELLAILPDWSDVERSKIFAVNFFADRSLSLRRENSKSLFEKAGKILSVGELEPENQLRGKFIMRGEKASIEIYFTLTPENPALIQQLNMKEVSNE